MTPDAPVLTVVPASAELCADLPNWFADAVELATWGGPGLDFPLTPTAIAAMLAEAASQPPARLSFSGVVAGEVVAHAQLALDWTNGVARLGRVALKPSARRHGLARPFLRQVMARLAPLGDFPRLELNVYTFNHRAMALYESLGFEREGVRRSSARVGQARWDTAIYAIITG